MRNYLHWFFCAWLCSPGALWALTVSPIYVKISPITRTTTFTAYNDQKEVSLIKVEARRWTQPQGKDTLSNTADLVVYPLQAKVPPGGSQTFRLMLRRPVQGPEYFRLLVNLIEVAPSRAATLHLGQSFSLPVFIEDALSRPQISAHRVQGGIAVSNQGSGHDFVEALQEIGGRRGDFRYILPGSQVRITDGQQDKNGRRSGPVQALLMRRQGHVPVP